MISLSGHLPFTSRAGTSSAESAPDPYRHPPPPIKKQFHQATSSVLRSSFRPASTPFSLLPFPLPSVQSILCVLRLRSARPRLFPPDPDRTLLSWGCTPHRPRATASGGSLPTEPVPPPAVHERRNQSPRPSSRSNTQYAPASPFPLVRGRSRPFPGRGTHHRAHRYLITSTASNRFPNSGMQELLYHP
jgi:hypothetical protein